LKASLIEDIIIQLTMDRGEVEVGNIPSGVSLERLRWAGGRLIDLMTLHTIYVRVRENNHFELHAIPLKGTHLVHMSYRDRRRLRVGPDGVPFIANVDMIAGEVKEEKRKAAEIKLRKRLGGQDKQFQNLMAFVAALIVYAGEEPVALKNFFTEISPHIKAAYPAVRYLDILREAAKELKVCLNDYHAELNGIDQEAEP